MINKIKKIKILDSGLSDDSKLFNCHAVKIVFEDFEINKKSNIAFIKTHQGIKDLEGSEITFTYSKESTFNLIKIV